MKRLIIAAMLLQVCMLDWSAAADEALLTAQQIHDTHSGKTLVGTTLKGTDLTLRLVKGGSAKANFTGFSGNEVEDSGGWSVKDDGTICIELERFAGGKKLCRKVRKSGAKFEQVGRTSGKVYYSYQIK